MRRLCWEACFQSPFWEQSIIPTITVFTDSSAAIDISGQEGLIARSKHIEVRFYHVKKLRFDSVIVLKHIINKDQIVDLLTKPVTRQMMKILQPRSLTETGLQLYG